MKSEVGLDKQQMLAAFERRIAPELRARGFAGEAGHYVRHTAEVTQIIELQVSVYGARVTANLGLDLPWLEPVVRWIEPPEVGPHAHEAVRWVRVGVARPGGRDRWWTFDSEPDLATAVVELGGEILGAGLEWLDRESERAAFLKEAEARVERSKGPRHPHGRFAELRLLAVVLAWNGQLDDARRIADLARSCWEDERQRLASALDGYRARLDQKGEPAPSVPDLARELEALISPTTGEFPPTRPPSGSRSSRPSGR